MLLSIGIHFGLPSALIIILYVFNAGNTQEKAQTDCVSSTTAHASPQTDLSSTITPVPTADISATTAQRTPEMPPLPVDVPTTMASVSPQDIGVNTLLMQLADNASSSQIHTPVTTTDPDIATETLQELEIGGSTLNGYYCLLYS